MCCRSGSRSQRQPDAFTASWNGQSLLSLTNANAPSSYTQYTFAVTGASGSSSTALQFAGGNLNNEWYLDDVSVTTISIPAGTTRGTLVSSLIANGSGPNNVTDVDAGAKTGIAITAAATTNGTWFYSTDGVHWIAVSSVSATNALLLAADTPPACTSCPTRTTWARQRSPMKPGIRPAAPPAPVNAGVTGGTSAFSSTAETATVTVEYRHVEQRDTWDRHRHGILYQRLSHGQRHHHRQRDRNWHDAEFDRQAGRQRRGYAQPQPRQHHGCGHRYFDTMAAFSGFSTVALSANPGNAVTNRLRPTPTSSTVRR